MSKGKVVLVSFPFTDLAGQKVRPALVLSAQKKGEDCVVVFISSHSSNKEGLFEVKVAPSTQNGLKRDSMIRVDKIATLQKKIVLGELGTLERTTLSLVDKKLRALFQI